MSAFAPERVTLDKVASSTRGLIKGRDTLLLRKCESRRGHVVIVKALQEKQVYDQLELPSGRMAKVSLGDIIAGPLGERRALRGFVGHVPRTLEAGDTIHLLNIGGVMGVCTSSFKDVGPPMQVRVMGMAVDKKGKIINIEDGALPIKKDAAFDKPVAMFSGTAMSAGKTQAACEVIAGLTRRGYRVAGAKLTGVACQKDLLNMEDHGAVRTLSFLDYGLPSTAGVEGVGDMWRAMLAELATGEVDVLAVEMGDGIVGSYGVDGVFDDPVIMRNLRAHVVCANDLLGAWGAARYLSQRQVPIHAFAGPATDNEQGTDYILRDLGIPAVNARMSAEKLADLVATRVFGRAGKAEG
ncbi:MAG: hypothetical protein HY719_02045 [Planctomycetes bacterium]|nr:hypothetical protein [Planctomycetota bacterium]